MSEIALRQQRLREFAQERDWEQFHTPKNLAMALAGEAGEVLEVLQWLNSEESRSLSPPQYQRLADELGDVFIYLLRLADVAGVDLLESVDALMERNERRFPVAKVRGRAEKRPPPSA